MLLQKSVSLTKSPGAILNSAAGPKGGRHDCMDGQRCSNIALAFPTSMWVTGGKATQDDSMDGIGRVVSGTKTEQLPRMPGVMPTHRKIAVLQAQIHSNAFA
jgi:hypothetical protein